MLSLNHNDLKTSVRKEDKNIMENVQCILAKLLQDLDGLNIRDVDESYVEKSVSTSILILSMLEKIEWNANCRRVLANVTENLRFMYDLVCGDVMCSNWQGSNLTDLLKNILMLICKIEPEDSCLHLANLYSYNLHLIKIQHECDLFDVKTEKTLLFRLEVHCIFLDCLIFCKNEQYCKFSTEFFKIMEENNVPNILSDNQLFSNLLISNNEAVSAQVLLCLIPKYLGLIPKFTLLQSIWNEILSKYEKNLCNLSKLFIILCYLSDYYFTSSEDSQTQPETNMILFEDEKYWQYLKMGLTHADSTVRKQSLFLFKKSISIITKLNVNIVCKKKDELTASNFDLKLNDGVIQLKNGLKNFIVNENKIFLVQKENITLFWWDVKLKDFLNKFYEDIILLMEFFENTQVHLISPVLSKVNLVVKQCISWRNEGKQLDLSWVVALYSLMLKHDNTSVNKWALINLLTVNVNILNSEQNLEDLIELIVTTLNNSNLYVKNENETEPEITQHLTGYFVKNKNSRFIKLFVQKLCKPNFNWNPLCLFYVLNCLSSIPKFSVLDEKDIVIITVFLQQSIRNFYTILQTAIQLEILKTVINITDSGVVKLDVIACFLGSFKTDNCLKRGTKIWNSLVEFISYCYSKKDAEEFILNFLIFKNGTDEKSFSKMLVLLFDANLFGIMKCCGQSPSCEILDALNNMLGCFKNYDKRAYVDENICKKNIEILCYVFQNNKCKQNKIYFEQTKLLELMVNYFPDIIKFIFCKYKIFDSLTDYEYVQIYCEVLEYILHIGTKFKLNVSIWTNEFYKNIIENLTKSCRTPIQNYFNFKILNIIINECYSETCIPNLEFLQSYLKKNVNTVLTKHGKEMELSRDFQVLWGKMNSEYLELKWQLLSRIRNENVYTISKSGDGMTVNKGLCNEELKLLCIEATEIAGYHTLVPVMNILQDVLLETCDLNIYKELIEVCWKLILEVRKNEIFWTASSCFIKMLYKNELIIPANNEDILWNYCKQIFSLSINSLVHSLVTTFMNNCNESVIRSNLFCKLVVRCVLYGSVMKRDDRMLAEAGSYYLSKNSAFIDDDSSVSLHVTDSEIRALGVKLVLKLKINNSQHQAVADKLTDMLLCSEVELCQNKKRYFGDSFIHRVKHRTMQILLLLQHVLSPDKTRDVYELLCDSLLSDNHQPSVRHMTEWMLVRLLTSGCVQTSMFWELFDKAQAVRVGSICSLTSIAYHLVVSTADYTEQTDMIDRAVCVILPYCMAQHYSLRLYSQVVLNKLFTLAEERGLKSVVNKHKVIMNCLKSSISYGQSIKNTEKLDNDFFFTVFNPFKHYTLQTIFVELPRLSRVRTDEWVSVDVLEKHVGYQCRIPLRNEDDSLKKQELEQTWSTKHGDMSADEELSGVNLQKKMIPWKNLVPNYDELLLQYGGNKIRKSRIKDGLIVVASLVDRLPNLGGLARTCEVFGVDEFVVGSLNYLQDQQFQSLSVTAEKWINITEVKQFYLKEYLLTKKTEGYKIVGAEQAVNSVSLNNFQFPVKCLLLLGNEKEGIPPDLLPMLDVCVEIPQLGIVRSLNVHVSGALFIWEYAKQYSLTHTLS